MSELCQNQNTIHVGSCHRLQERGNHAATDYKKYQAGFHASAWREEVHVFGIGLIFAFLYSDFDCLAWAVSRRADQQLRLDCTSNSPL